MTYTKDNNLNAHSVCIVGDEDQSIYSWRGATASNILNFKNDYPKTEQIKIEQNYRSVQPILKTANKVISNNKHRNEKKLWSDKKAVNRILKIKCQSDYQESDIAVETVKAAKFKNHSAAILYRTHFQSRVIEEALIKNSIPYTMVGGIQFYERKEVKDILSYLKLIVNPFDKVSLSRVINCPTRKLGDKFQEMFEEHWSAEPLLDFKQLANKIITENYEQKSKLESLNKFCKIFDGLNANSKPTEAINQILKSTDYFAFIKDTDEGQEVNDRIDNIKELVRATEHIEDLEAKTVSSFLEEVALMQDKLNNKKEKEDHVKLMTLHAAKGLEFDVVMISGLEEGMLPSARSLESREDIEEERRLFYVGITRAREYLILSHSNYRNTFGQTNTQAPSRFLEEADSEYINEEDCSFWSRFNFENKISEFLGATVTFNNNVQTFKAFIPAHASSPKNIPMITKNKLASAPKTPIGKNFSNIWQINQPVTHATFGLGIIQKLENKGAQIFISVKFKAGLKKIESSFLTKC